ncbi:MAG: alpha/beta hydrolase family protein [Verrucomicrobiaceae bacterium]
MKPSPPVRFLSIFPLLLLWSCTARIDPSVDSPPPAKPSLSWPKWQAVPLAEKFTVQQGPHFPSTHHTPAGPVTTYGPDDRGHETFCVISKRELDSPPGIVPLNMQFFPTSFLAGPSPYKSKFNELHSPTQDFWFFSAFPFRSTFFETFPATTPEPKGMIHYQTSIMMLSQVERMIVQRLQNHGWHVLVGLPSDSFYRSRLPAYATEKEDLGAAARFLANHMDQHYAGQAYATKAALAYLRKTRPDWLSKKRVLIGTSAGSFTTPAVALQTPGWDAIVFVSAGTNLLDAYQRDAAGVFEGAMKWADWVRADPPPEARRIPTEPEYRQLYQRAAQLTKLHSGRLAPHLANERLLFIHGTIDRIIPSDQFAELYHQLGRPERWTYPLGHHLVALQLLKDVPRLDQWIDDE